MNVTRLALDAGLTEAQPARSRGLSPLGDAVPYKTVTIANKNWPDGNRMIDALRRRVNPLGLDSFSKAANSPPPR